MNSKYADAFFIKCHPFDLYDCHRIGDIIRKLIRLDIEYIKLKCSSQWNWTADCRSNQLLHFTDNPSLSAEIYTLSAEGIFTEKMFRFIVFTYILFGLIAETRLTTQSDNNYNYYGYDDENHALSKRKWKSGSRVKSHIPKMSWNPLLSLFLVSAALKDFSEIISRL